MLVVAPGAGVSINAEAYRALESAYNVVRMDTKTRKDGFKYPAAFFKGGGMKHVALSTDPPNSLCGLAREIGRQIVDRTLATALVITGPRGGQVVLPLLLRCFWRGPFININAGLLSSAEPVPAEAMAYYLTMGKDEGWRTSDPSYVRDAHRRLAPSPHRGYNVHLFKHGHMPMLRGRNRQLLRRLCQAAIAEDRPPSAPPMTQDNHEVYDLSSAASTPASPPQANEVTVQSRRHANVKLRRHATSEHEWYADQRAVSNGETVRVVGAGADQQGFAMLRIVAGPRRRHGWIYTMNIREFQ